MVTIGGNRPENQRIFSSFSTVCTKCCEQLAFSPDDWLPLGTNGKVVFSIIWRCINLPLHSVKQPLIICETRKGLKHFFYICGQSINSLVVIIARCQCFIPSLLVTISSHTSRQSEINEYLRWFSCFYQSNHLHITMLNILLPKRPVLFFDFGHLVFRWELNWS